MCENVFVDIEKLLVGDYTPVDNVKEEKEPGRKVIPAVDIDILVILHDLCAGRLLPGSS